ncbi:MAG: hypothetical protein ACOCZK_04175 [Planctomycetota bacterium]
MSSVSVILIPLVLCLFCVGCSNGAASGEGERPSASPDAPSDAKQATDASTDDTAEWEYRVRFENKGTRSESRHGMLVKDGKPVLGKQKGETRETPIGTFRWQGLEKPVLWADTGWTRIAGEGPTTEVSDTVGPRPRRLPQPE